jgi:DNA-binding beta-propeller fold protein YncE
MTKGLAAAGIVIAMLTFGAGGAAAAPGDVDFDFCASRAPQEPCVELFGELLNGVNGVAVSADGKSVYTVSAISGEIAHFFRVRSNGILIYDGCLNDDGSNGCRDLPGEPLKGAESVAVSRDGKSVYVSASGNDTVSHFFRGGPDGQIAYDGCLNNDGSNFCTAVPGSPINNPESVAVSPDGKSVYATSFSANAILHFDRSGPDGQIVWNGCFDDAGLNGCIDLPGTPLTGANGITVSPDSKSVYAASWIADSVTHFFRGTDGELAYDGCLNNDGTSGCTGVPAEPFSAPADVEVSADGKSVYAVSLDDSIAHMFRSGPDGQIAWDGCLNNDGSQSCADVPGTPLNASGALATSADNESVYVTALGSDSLSHLLRAGPDGQIIWGSCLANTTFEGCDDLSFGPLDGADDVAVSPDGISVYVVSFDSDSITHFTREPVPEPPPAPEPGPQDPGGPGPGPGQLPDTQAPVISRLAVSNARFRVGAAATPLAARRAPVGTSFRYALSEPAAVSVTIQRSRGRRWVKAATLRRAGRQGANRLGFSGRIGRRKLAPGRYRAIFTATDARGNRSSGARVGFRVLPR